MEWARDVHAFTPRRGQTMHVRIKQLVQVSVQNEHGEWVKTIIGEPAEIRRYIKEKYD